MNSLSKGAKIIGPDSGAFKDLAKEKLICTYNNFDELINILRSDKFVVDKNRLDNFLELNSWNNFAKNISLKIREIV